jgi:hypothetical protein
MYNLGMTAKPFNIVLSPEHRERLDAYRAARGLKSDADAVRDLIDRYWPGAKEAEAKPFNLDEERDAALAIEPGPIVQYGPTKRDPGALLKKPRGKAS